VLTGLAEVSARAARFHGSVRPLLGVVGLLGLSEEWRLGGGGLLVSGGTELKTTGPLAGSQLHMGYGGVVLERTLRVIPVERLSNPSSLNGRILLGVGNASVRDPVTRIRFRSDNFAVVEPALLLVLRPHAWLGGAALASYRIAMGVEDLGEVDASELRGWSIGLSLQLGPF
jgi:hypothetical protein